MPRQAFLLLLLLAQGLRWCRAQPSPQCEELRNSFLSLPNATTSVPCCNETTQRDFYAACDSLGRITEFSFNGAASKRLCTNDTASLLMTLTDLRNLTLDYYIDIAKCPDVFSPGMYQNMTRLSSLALRGSQLTSKISIPAANVSSSAVEMLDLSYSTLPSKGPPPWLRQLFPHVKHLTWLSDAPTSDMHLPCGSYTNLTVSIVPTTDQIQWITNCTNLEQLDLRIGSDHQQRDMDISAWLEPISTRLTALQSLSVFVDDSAKANVASTFPAWLTHLGNLSTVIYRVQIKDRFAGGVLDALPLTVLDMHGNGLYGDIPPSLSGAQLEAVDLSDNALTGTIPSTLRNTTSCNLDGNPILCAGVGNPWSLCQHCGLVPGFLGVMLRYKIQWIVILACLALVLLGWVYVAFRKHQQTSFRVWVGVFYSLFSFINLLTTVVHLGMNVTLYTTTFSIMLAATALYLLINSFLYRYCCRRFSILVIRRTWPVFLLCCLDMNNFALYEIRMLNLSAYRKQIDLRVPVVLSWQKVLVADVAHTATSIFLIMLHSPVASILLTCITSGLGIVRAIAQVCLIWYRARKERKFHPIGASTTQHKTVPPSTAPSSSTVHSQHTRTELELTQLIHHRDTSS